MIIFFKRSVFLLILTIVFALHASATMRITEYMYSGLDGEFVEFTNFSDSPVDMTGWSFSDDHRIVGAYYLSAFGEVQPGESVILTESSAEQFRAAWGLPPTSAIIGELGVYTGNNLGRNDEINLYDNTGTLVDRLTYSDESFPGTSRTSRTSAWVTPEGLGLDNPYQWALSALDDGQSSWSSTSGDVGSPASHYDAPPPPLPLPPPVISQPGGMYNVPITVEMSTTEPDAVIRFTLDGSVPTEDSPQYVSPLSMNSLAGTPNDISEIPTSSWAWEPPAGEVFKANILRARVFKADAIPSTTISRTYFIDPEMTTRYSLALVSLITEPDNLFDYYTGIYVPGDSHNFEQRGDEWERDVHVELFDSHLSDTQPPAASAFAQDMGMRTHGGFSREFSRKSLRLYARSEYGASRLEYPVLGPDIPEGPDSFKRLVLRNGGNDCYKTLIRDAFAHELVRNTDIAALLHRPVIVFINGEYWGIHMLMERLGKYYLGDNYGVDPYDLDVISFYDIMSIDEGDADAYFRMRDFLDDNNLADPYTYQSVEALINIPNHITYYATQIFIQNHDWTRNNQKLWQPRDGSRSWEWLFFDTDESMGAIDYEYATFNKLRYTAEETEEHAYVFTRLLTSPQYRQAFITRYADLLNTRFTVDYMLARLNAIRDTLEPEMLEHVHRWRDPSLSEWNYLVDKLEEWCEHRPAYAWHNLEDYFGLDGRSQLTVNVNDPDRGAIAVNTLPKEEIPLPWTGSYFHNVPVTVTAEPAPGYQFARWLGLDQISSAMSIYLTEDTTLTALFEPEAVPPTSVCRDVTVELDTEGTVTITGADVDGGSTDNFGISSLTVDPDTFTCANVGENTVTLTVTDLGGNTATCQATVTVEDNIPPTTVCRDITVELDAAGTATITGADVDGGSADNCGISSMTVEPATFGCTDLGDNTVTLTVTDVGGNTATCQATVTVEDNIPPTTVCRDITVELDATGTAIITGTDVDGGSADNCGISSMTVEPATFGCTDLGDNTVTLTVTDVAGNTATCQAAVTVTDPLGVCLPGDVNRDGDVDAVDVQLVINEVLGLGTGRNCDINGDDSVDAIDVQLLVNAALGLNISGSMQ